MSSRSKQPPKLRMLWTLVFPGSLCGAGSWTIKAKDRRKIDAFKMAGLVKTNKVIVEKRTNELILS